MLRPGQTEAGAAAEIRADLLAAYEQARAVYASDGPTREIGAWGATVRLELPEEQGPGVVLPVSRSNRRFGGVNDLVCAERRALAEALDGVSAGGRAIIRSVAVLPHGFADPELVRMTPCGKCLQTFRSMVGQGRMHPEETVVATLERDEGKGNGKKGRDLRIVVRPLKAFIGRFVRPVSFTEAGLAALPVRMSPAAGKLARTSGIRQAAVRQAMAAARAAWQEAQQLSRSEKNGRYAGAAALFVQPGDGLQKTPPVVVSGMALHPKQYREALLAEMDALSRALASSGGVRGGAQQPEHLKLLAYFGQDDETPSLVGLENIAKLARSTDILLALIEDGEIRLTTLQEELPLLYARREHFSRLA